MVRTRFAPSPTGALHIGGVRTALYAYLVASRNQGSFYLRIEDTDKARFVEGAVEDIIETLNWLGLKFEGEPIFQSKRLDIYKDHAQKLIRDGFAYEQEGAVYFKTKKDGKTSITDLVGKRVIEFDNATQHDFVILKSDGYPTYHLAHVVDDHLMETNPVIRGAEWISSIPKHVMLFEAFGWQVPRYAHLPIILGSDKSKLSKRHGAKPASEFRKDGYLAEAILNYMALLGWTPPSGQEILSLEELISEFDLSEVNNANPIFDITKLEWMNGEYIRKMSGDKLEEKLDEYLVDHPAKGKLTPLIPLIKDRIKKLSDFIPLTDFFFAKVEYEKEIFTKVIGDKGDLNKIVTKVLDILKSLPKPWEAKEFENRFRKLAEELGLSATQIFQLIRVIISGQLVTPPLFESIQILGEDEVINRAEDVAISIGSW